jgi:exonuclease VII large subunit
MKKEFMVKLSEVTTRIRALRENLPEVNSEDLTTLSAELAELDLSQASKAEVISIQDAFECLADEVNQTMQRLDQCCNELRTSVQDLQHHNTGVKAYAIAQNS